MNYKLIWLMLFGLAALLMAYTRTERKQKVIFFGDSITQLGVQPKGYISLIDSAAHQEGLNDHYELTGAGIGGNKIYDLYLRLEQDVLLKKPDIVVMYIGVNDVWHKRLLGTGTDYDKFGKFYEAVVRKIQAAGATIILCTPAVIGERTDHSNEQDGDLNLYSNWIRHFAGENKIQLVDLRKLFLDYNLQHNINNQEKGILTTDRVHLNEAGNTLVAAHLWNSIKKVAGK